MTKTRKKSGERFSSEHKDSELHEDMIDHRSIWIIDYVFISFHAIQIYALV